MPSLIVTYTENNQAELKRKIISKRGTIPENIEVKGWFSFLLEDLIRPYQKCVLPNRVSQLNFNQEGDPHTRDGRSIPGTGERRDFVRHFTTSEGTRAHSTYISKLSMRIAAKTKGASFNRLARMHGAVFFDEVQDLVGWDYEVMSGLSQSDLGALYALGDFRQTVYQTHAGAKRPVLANEKRKKFESMGFKSIPMSGSWRCVQSICEFSDHVHHGEGYEPTQSRVDKRALAPDAHTGVFAVSRSHAAQYIARVKPVILRHNKTVERGLCEGSQAINFGGAKGLEFDHVMIIPTSAQKQFLLGNRRPLESGKTEQAKNLFYVALTRGRFSTAILLDEEPSFKEVQLYGATQLGLFID